MEEKSSHISITRSRLNNVIKKRKKRSKRFIIGLLSSSIIGIGVATWMGLLIYDQYQGTKTWNHTKIQGVYADVPPEFVKNTVDPNMIDGINKLSSMSSFITTIEKTGIIDQLDTIKTVIEQANSIFEEYDIKSGNLVTLKENLELYVKISEFEASAYKNPDSETLKDVINKLSTKVISEDKEGDKLILSRLNTIADNYKLLNDFIETYIPKLGTITNNVLSIKEDFDFSVSDEMLTKIEEYQLDKFENISTIKTLLTSQEWSTIRTNYDSKHRKIKWEKAKSIFNTLAKTQYIKVSDIRTYKDAQEYGHAEITGIVQKDGYELLLSSRVKSISYGEETLTNDQYIKKGTPIKVTIDPSYNKIASSSTNSSTRDSSTTHSSSNTSTPSSVSNSNITTEPETRTDLSTSHE